MSATGITGPLREDIDRLWMDFWVGGITNPLTVIEQASYLMFCRLLDQAETRAEQRARALGRPHSSVYPAGKPLVRWGAFSRLESAERMLAVVRDEVFPFLRGLGGERGRYLKDAALMIVSPQLLYKAVGAIGRLPLDGDRKGDLYEYLLGKLNTAGINGQFRTPRHVIALMVDLMAPRPDQAVADPACGTGGFLVAVLENLFRRYTSPAGVSRVEDEDGPREVLTGDLMEGHRAHRETRMLWGFDFDITMLRIASMNLMLHGIESPNVLYQNALSATFGDNHPGQAREAFDLVLANPPFTGTLDENDIDPALSRVAKTKKTELLFLALILRMLKPAGRAAVIVPQGVLFGSSKAHVALRRHLLDDHQTEAVMALPGGVFKPYAGVATAVLVFTKGGRTGDVWFYDVESDGRSLDDKRVLLDGHDGDFADVREKWGKREAGDRTGKAFTVAAAEIRENGYDLTVGRYREAAAMEEKHEPPGDILRRLEEEEERIAEGLRKLREAVG
ncbi:MAG: type I restriction-modification system subunit M [Gemmataceae bacterium]|nr:type I restriction-modification system subunit M [Gemmataceae bacterium]